MTAARAITALTFIGPPAARTQAGIHLVHPPEEAGPRAADRKGHPMVRAGEMICALLASPFLSTLT